MPRRAEPHQHKASGLWYACIGERGKDGRAKEVYAPQSVRTRADAWRWLDAELDRRKAESTPITPEALTVEQLGELYTAWAQTRSEGGKLSPEHLKAKMSHLVHFGVAFGHRPAVSVSPHEIEEFAAALQAPTKDERGQEVRYSVSYAANICATVAAVFNWGTRQQFWATSPIAGFKAPVVPESPERYATRGEAATWLRFLWRRTPKDLSSLKYRRVNALMQRVLIHTGARPKELCCLRWSDIRWSARRTPAGHPAGRATIPADRWKAGDVTGKSRVIYLSPTLTRALRRLRGRSWAHPEYVFVHGRGRGGRGAGQPWKDGSAISNKIRSLRRELVALQAPILERTKHDDPTVTDAERRIVRAVIRDEGDNRLVNYRWRHTAASTLLMDGVDVPTVAKLLGTSPEMIYRNYGHLLAEHVEAAADRLTAGRRAKKP